MAETWDDWLAVDWDFTKFDVEDDQDADETADMMEDDGWKVVTLDDGEGRAVFKRRARKRRRKKERAGFWWQEYGATSEGKDVRDRDAKRIGDETHA